MIESARTPEPRVQGQGICLFASRATKDNLRLRNDSSNEFLTRSNVNQQRVSHELRARSRYAVQRVSHSFRRASRSFQIHLPRVSHSCRRASRSFQIRNSRWRSIEDRQPPCSASTATRSRGKELNGAPLPCLPCFCSVSCAQGMTFCLTLKGCASHRCHRAESNVQCTSMACGWSGTNTPPDEGSHKLTKNSFKWTPQNYCWHSTQLRHIVSSQSSTFQISAVEHPLCISSGVQRSPAQSTRLVLNHFCCCCNC